MSCQLTRGFTLIEVLVTLVILTFGLLGIGGLMAKGQRVSYESFQRHQALQIANEMAERLRANKLETAVYTKAAPVGTPVGTGTQFDQLKSGKLTPHCGNTACNGSQLAAYDVALWDGLLQGYSELNPGAQRSSGVVTARGCIEAVDATTFRISVSWQGNDEVTPPADRPSTCGTGVYGVSDGYRRLVSLDVAVF